MFKTDPVQWNRSAFFYCPFTSFVTEGSVSEYCKASLVTRCTQKVFQAVISSERQNNTNEIRTIKNDALKVYFLKMSSLRNVKNQSLDRPVQPFCFHVFCSYFCPASLCNIYFCAFRSPNMVKWPYSRLMGEKSTERCCVTQYHILRNI